MRPIPVAFHVWFLEIHTYGIGLAITFWFGLRYTERRLRRAGYRWEWVTGMFVWIVVAAIAGARLLHVLSHLPYYLDHPAQVAAVWQGGLSSFGGLLAAVPVAIVSARRRCPELPTLRFGDLLAPVLMACWGMGRLLGPQLMVNGGGHPTHQWFGMYYAGSHPDVKVLPVPIFQALEDFAIFGILLLVERWLVSRGPAPSPADASAASDEMGSNADGDDGPGTGQPQAAVPVPLRRPPDGVLLGTGMVLWGIERSLDEHLWLGEDGHLGSLLVQVAGISLSVAGAVLLASRLGAVRRWLAEGRSGRAAEVAHDGDRASLADS